MTEYEDLKKLVEAAAPDVAKADQGVSAAAVRVRKAMQAVKAKAQAVRVASLKAGEKA